MNGTRSKRPIPFGDLDRRTYEYRCLTEFRDGLIEQLGGNITITQRVLIDRTAWLLLKCRMLEGKLAHDGLTEMDTRVFLAWQNALRRNLVALGLNDKRDNTPPLDALSYAAAVPDEVFFAQREQHDAAD